MQVIYTLGSNGVADSDLYGAYIDKNGNIYYSASDLAVVYIIKKGTSNPQIFAGKYNVSAIGGDTGDGGPASSATLFYPAQLVGDSNGNIYLVDDCRIRKIDTKGIISNIAGTGVCTKMSNNYTGDGNLATATVLVDPFSVAVDKKGNIYIGDEGGARYVSSSNGIVSTFEKSLFNSIAINPISQEIWVGTFINNQILKCTISNGCTVIYGNGTSGSTNDGPINSSSLLNGPYSLTFRPNTQNLYFSEVFSNKIRYIDTKTNIIYTVAGTGNTSPIVLGPAAPMTVNLNTPWGLSVNSNGNIVVTESNSGNPNGPPLHIYLISSSNSLTVVSLLPILAIFFI